MTSWLSAVPSSAMELPSLCPLPCFKRNTAASAWWHGLSQGNKIRSTRAWFLLQSASGKSRQQDKASRSLRSRDGVLRFSLCLFPLWQGPGSAPCDGQTYCPAAEGCPSSSHSSPAPQALPASHAKPPQNWVLTWRAGGKPWGSSLGRSQG